MKLLFSDKNNKLKTENIEKNENPFLKKDILNENELRQIKGGSGDDDTENDETVVDWE